MSKVKLTKEQAEEIKKIEDVDYAINILSLSKRPDNPLAELSIAEVARALYIGYEVEPEFKVGDWVVHVHGYIGKITKITNKGVVFIDAKMGNGRFVNTFPVHYRHATSEEIAKEKEWRFFARHGRKPWELKIFDILHGGHYSYVITGIDHEHDSIELDGVNNYYLNDIKGKFKVACFAENRLDVKDDEWLF